MPTVRVRAHIAFEVADAETLSHCVVGDCVKLWSKPHLDDIYVYGPQGLCGQGRLGRFAKAQFAVLGRVFETAEALIVAVDGVTVRLAIGFEADEADLPAEGGSIRE